ncbi:CHASE3 domain-containing protein [Rhizobium sp. YIM 134829]|uniref:CHASE3 domain-containing protein n=1 Tax=Rhizobium sp. YIM 134829 TaxID=3390453 RepID=UPI00397AFFCA
MTIDQNELSPAEDTALRKRGRGVALKRVGYEARRNLLPITLAVVFVVAVLIGFSLWISDKAQNADAAVTHTVRNHQLLSVVQSLLQDAEIGQRGYILTGDSFYLEPYDRAISEIESAVGDLQSNVADNSVQTANVAVLRGLIAQKLSELRQSVQRRRDGDQAGALAVLKTGQGKVLMDGVRDVLSRMRAEEDRLMEGRAEQASRAGFIMEMMVIGLSLLAAAVGLTMLHIALRRARSAEAARDELLSRLDRKLLAILAADIAGYSRLMEGNETVTLDRLRHVRDLVDPIIVEHQGTIVNTAGDSVLAAFSSALSAIDCALEIQARMEADNRDVAESDRLLFRIGLNVGDVIVRNGDVFGDTVNVAARLEALANPGGICISRTVRDHIRKQRDLTFDDLGFQTLKNIAHPISAFRVRAGHGA